MALIRTGACPIILPVSMTKNSANMLQKICSDNQDAIIMADDMGKVCVQTLLPDIKLPLPVSYTHLTLPTSYGV